MSYMSKFKKIFVLGLLAFTQTVMGATITDTNTYNFSGTLLSSNLNASTVSVTGKITGPTPQTTNDLVTKDYADHLPAPIRITDARFYLAGLSNALQSVRAKFSVSQMPSSRDTDIVYANTNMLFYSVTSTVAGVAGQFSNNVSDASGFIPGDMYTKPDASLATWQTCSNGSGTAVYWANELGDVSSNLVATSVGSTISRVNRFRVPDYTDATGGSNIFCYLRFLTPYTNTVAWSITYWSCTNFTTITGSQVLTNSAAITIPYVR